MKTTALASKSRALPESSREARDPWPRGFSREPNLAIGAVQKMLVKEFPSITVSKLRFLETEGLITPQRTASGYRKYSRSDVERIRYILAEQRDSYAPVKVILESLQSLDAGRDVDPPARARIVASEGKTVVPSGRATITARELSDLTGASRKSLEEFVRLGLIAPDLAGHFQNRTVMVVNLIIRLVAAGVPPRNLRSIRIGADRSADLIDQLILAGTRRDRPGDRERALAQANNLTELLGSLHVEYLRSSVESVSHD